MFTRDKRQRWVYELLWCWRDVAEQCSTEEEKIQPMRWHLTYGTEKCEFWEGTRGKFLSGLCPSTWCKVAGDVRLLHIFNFGRRILWIKGACWCLPDCGRWTLVQLKVRSVMLVIFGFWWVKSYPCGVCRAHISADTKHQSLPLTLDYFGSGVRSDTSLFQKGLLTDGQ